MKRFLVNSLSLCLAFVQGCYPTCVRSRFYQLPQTDLCQNVEAARVTNSFTKGDFACSENWWDFFQDPHLKYFIELSLSCHPDIFIADSRVRRACFEALENRSLLLPHVYLFTNIAREHIGEFASPVPGVFGTFTQSQVKVATASFELDLWKKNRALFYAALEEAQAQQAEFEEVKLILSTSVAAVYFDLQMNLQRKRVNEERLRARKELYDLLQQQFQSGVIAQFRLYETDTEVEVIQDTLYQIEGQIEIDKHALAALVGNLNCGLLDFNFMPNAKFARFPLPCTLPFDLLARRPDIHAQLARIEADKFYVHVAKVKFYPRFDLLAYAGFLSYFKFENLFNAKSLVALAEATGVLPLFTAGKLRAELGIAKEDLEIAIQKYNQKVLDAVREVSDALSNLTYADQRLGTITESLSNAENLYELTNQKFINGVANRIALLNALENLYIQRDLEIKILLTRYESAVDLIRAIGGGYYDSRCCPS